MQLPLMLRFIVRDVRWLTLVVGSLSALGCDANPPASTLPASGTHIETTAAIDASSYGTYLSDTTLHYDEVGPMHVEINWNPKAPAGFQGIYTLDVLTQDSRLVVFYTDSTKGLDACAWFSADGIQIVDNTCRSKVTLPPIDMFAGGTSTGQPTELAGLRLLLGANAVPKCMEVLGGLRQRSLDKQQTATLLRHLYTDEGKLPPSAPAQLTTTLVHTNADQRLQQISWREEAGEIMHVTFTPLTSERAAARLDSFAWSKEIVAACPRPSLQDVISFFAREGLSDANESTIQTLRVPGGDAETAHVELNGVRVYMYVGSVGIGGGDGIKVTRRGSVVIVTHISDRGIPVGITANLEGHDWTIGCSLLNYPENVKTAAEFSNSAARFLEDCMRSHDSSKAP